MENRPNSIESSAFDRRKILKTSIAGTVTAALSGGLGYAGTTDAVVETDEGKLRGRRVGSVYEFRGVRYAEPQTPSNRFKPALPLKPWSDVRDATRNGNRASQLVGPYPDIANTFLSVDSPTSEDCLFINIYTPAITREKKRAVMFWCHGGGYAQGAATLPPFEGDNLAKFGDVVIVSVTHRLNAFGFAYLAELGGEQFADSGNLGMLDIVLSLKWVQRNIAAFGGDSGNVTIFGFSGGGNKVSTLMAMPAANGLFHKAIVESGSGIRAMAPARATENAKEFVKILGGGGDNISKLTSLPADQLLAAMQSVKGGFSPVVDGRNLPRNPFDPDAPPQSRDIPMIIGTNRTEQTYFSFQDPALFSLDNDGLRTRLNTLLKDKADPILTVFRKSHPEASPSLLYFLIATDIGMRRAAITQAERKAEQGGAPAYMYHLAWNTPVDGGKWYSPHTLQVPFVWRNVDILADLVGKGPQQNALCERMSSAWVAFAKTGNPSNSVTGQWPRYDKAKRNTMVFDNDTRVVSDPEGADRAVIFEQMGPA